MTSIPSQASQRRSSLEQTAEPLPQGPSSQPESSPETFILNTQPVSSEPTSSDIPLHQPPQTPTQEPRRCWICQQDSTEDPSDTEWRNPCPCSLTAHEQCLLEWITSEEAPRPGELASTRHIVCPQCHTEIQIERPRDYLVLTVEGIQRVAKVLILPTALSSVFACFYSGFLMYGINTLQMVFGRDEAYQIIALWGTRDLQVANQIQPDQSGLNLHTVSRFLRRVSMSFDPFLPSADFIPHWKLFVGLPLIAPSLILSRTRLAEPFFATIPVTYLIFRPSSYIRLQEWPPSPAATIAIIPYLHAFYNELYRYTFGDLERKWDAAVQRRPRDGETAEEIARQQNGGEGDELFDLELEFINGDPDNMDPRDVENQIRAIADRNQAAGGEAANPQQEQEGPLAGGVNQAELQQGRNGNNLGFRRNISASVVASTVMGALFFPTISSIMGDLLKVTLPKDWVTKKSIGAGAKGLLQEKWGRSIVGGCLFVVLKDALVLYCKWKRARDFGKKRVLDYVGRRSGQASA